MKMEIEDKKIVKLYGGAIEVTLPKDFYDLSDIIPVEDNQEVFTDLKFDAKLIIEVLECLEPEDDKAIVANFNELASANDAIEPVVIEHKKVTDGVPKIGSPLILKHILKGTQKIRPSKRLLDPRELVTMLILHLRVKQHDADILITLNVPQKISQPERYENILQYHHAVFELICSSIEIKDLSLLFGEVE